MRPKTITIVEALLLIAVLFSQCTILVILRSLGMTYVYYNHYLGCDLQHVAVVALGTVLSYCMTIRNALDFLAILGSVTVAALVLLQRAFLSEYNLTVEGKVMYSLAFGLHFAVSAILITKLRQQNSLVAVAFVALNALLIFPFFFIAYTFIIFHMGGWWI